ncbi:hypothetical protein V3C99_007862, partial [Haemonchus contortus]
IMTADSADSSFTCSDDEYSISEDDAYVYCRVKSSPTKIHTAERAGTPKATLQSWRSCRDSGFVDHVHLLNRTQSANFEDHTYYNLLPFQEVKEDHDYTYPALATESAQDIKIRRPEEVMNLRRLKRKLRRFDSHNLSTLSVRTVVNGARPYRGCQEGHATPHLPATFKKTISHRRPCVECREEELRDIENVKGLKAEFESLRKIKDNEAIELYGRLIIVAIEELQAEPDGKERIAAFQRKIEKILRLRTGLDLSKPNEDFRKNAQIFETLIERRLRAINDISPSSCQKLADKLCLTQSAARRVKSSAVRLGSIRRGIRKFLGFF